MKNETDFKTKKMDEVTQFLKDLENIESVLKDPQDAKSSESLSNNLK